MHNMDGKYFSAIILNNIQSSNIQSSTDIVKLYPYFDKLRDTQSNVALCMKEFPKAKPKGTPESKGLYLTMYPNMSNNTDSIPFLVLFAYNGISIYRPHWAAGKVPELPFSS